MPRRGKKSRWTRTKTHKAPADASHRQESKWESALREIYTDVGKAGAFSASPEILKKELSTRFKINYITSARIKKWLEGQYTYSVHKRAPVNFQRNPILAAGIDHQWEGDLMFFPETPAKFNKGFDCALVIVDVVSRYAWVEPMKGKSGKSTVEAFEAILNRASPRKPKKLHTDNGKEFLNAPFQVLLRSNEIDFFTTRSDKKAAIAERFIQTIKGIINKYLRHNNTKRWIDVIQNAVDTYNSNEHSSIGMAPADVNAANENDVLARLYGHLLKKDFLRVPKFEIGDFVRLSKIYSNVFRKSFRGNYTDEIFKISKILDTIPKNMYNITALDGEEIMGAVYEDELQKIPAESLDAQFWEIEKILKTKTNKSGSEEYFVKWKGFDDSHNSWVSSKHMKSSSQ